MNGPFDLMVLETYPTREREYWPHLDPELRGKITPHFIPAPTIEADRDLRRPEQWVDYHLRQVQARAGTAPFGLLGFSYGGILALEVAGALADAGTPVGWVGVIDTWRPEVHPRTVPDKVLTLVADLAARPSDERRPFLAAQARDSVAYRRRQARRLADRAASRLPPPIAALWPARSVAGPEMDHVDARSPEMRAIQVSLLKYVVHTIAFPVALFWTAASARHFGGDPSLGWSAWLRGGFEQWPIDGDHFTALQPPHVSSAGAAIRRSAERAQLRL